MPRRSRVARFTMSVLLLLSATVGFGVGSAMPAAGTDGCGGDWRIVDRRDAFGNPGGSSLRGHLENHRCLDFGLQEFSWFGWQESKTGTGAQLNTRHFLRVRAWTCGSLYANDSVNVESTWRTQIQTGYSNHNVCPPQGDAYGEMTRVGQWKWTWYRNV